MSEKPTPEEVEKMNRALRREALTRIRLEIARRKAAVASKRGTVADRDNEAFVRTEKEYVAHERARVAAIVAVYSATGTIPLRNL